MGLMEMSLESNLLGKTMNLSVYCPEGYERVKLPVLFFLHGRTGNEQLLQQLGMDKIADALIEAGESNLCASSARIWITAEESILQMIIRRSSENMI